MNVSKKPIQYPSQTGPYKLFVKDKGIWQNHSHARLQISVGNPKHDGDKFFALAEWAAARFNHITLIVSDTLQRHNIALSNACSMDIAHNISLKRGDFWIKENENALNILSSKTLTRWNDWLSEKDYPEAYKSVCELYRNAPEVRAAINAKAAEFSERHSEGSGISQDTSIQTSINYILEEIAIFAIMFLKQNAVDIYPGPWFKEVFESIDTSANNVLFAGFRNPACLRVDFVRNKAPLREEIAA